MVNHPQHYNDHPSGIECNEIQKYLIANVSAAHKYLWRLEGKDDPAENVDKAIWYIKDQIALEEKMGESFSFCLFDGHPDGIEAEIISASMKPHQAPAYEALFKYAFSNGGLQALKSALEHSERLYKTLI